MIVQGDALERLGEMPAASVHCCVTSPPYFGLRDYGQEGQIGLEATPDAYVAKLVEVFREVKRVLRDDGTLWLNLGDSYAGGGGFAPDAPINQARANGEGWGALKSSSRAPREAMKGVRRTFGLKPKDLLGIPWMVAFALRADGWYLRSEIIWAKPNPMPESVTDRPTKAHEQVFLFSKSPRYFYDADAIREAWTCDRDDMREKGVRTGLAYLGSSIDNSEVDAEFGEGARRKGETPSGRNKRSVWAVATHPYPDAHFATFPPKLIEPMILAGCPRGGTVLDPFFGAGTTGMVAEANGREGLGIELNPEYVALAERRLVGVTSSMFDAA